MNRSQGNIVPLFFVLPQTNFLFNRKRSTAQAAVTFLLSTQCVCEPLHFVYIFLFDIFKKLILTIQNVLDNVH